MAASPRFVTRRKGSKFYVHDTIMGRPASPTKHDNRERAEADTAYYNDFGTGRLGQFQGGTAIR